MVSRRTHRKHIRCPEMDICEPHRKHLFNYCCIYSALHSNGSYPIVACILRIDIRAFASAGMCLENTSCNAFSIVAFAYFGRCLEIGLHVTIYRSVWRILITSSYQAYNFTWMYRLNVLEKLSFLVMMWPLVCIEQNGSASSFMNYWSKLLRLAVGQLKYILDTFLTFYISVRKDVAMYMSASLRLEKIA
jgi:hypothetical protein